MKLNTVLRVVGVIALFWGFSMTISELQGFFIVTAVSKYSGIAGQPYATFYGPALMLAGAAMLYFSLPPRW